MTERFKAFMPFIFKWEGGYCNDPDDPGGETNFGIDKRSHPNVDIKNLTRDEAREIYWREYWRRFDCERYARSLGEVFFNACVNCGAGRARKLMTESGTAEGFLTAQEAFYRRLAESRPGLKKFVKGWLNRTADLRRWIAA